MAGKLVRANVLRALSIACAQISETQKEMRIMKTVPVFGSTKPVFGDLQYVVAHQPGFLLVRIPERAVH